ncbi:MAG: bifunctional precorrin-2 dehydrogenase/sirohydrochlorin ferrochelatase [Armatimonadetes bacterium]|nr:bifunctional precorrin-2 dehydrogenase/sirohydrochlorin ferrochelatase [Armatimonadota bacterium]
MSESRLPVALELRGRRVVVIGGGQVARRKVLSLLDAEAVVTVVAPRLCAELAELVAAGRIGQHARGYAEGDLADAWLAFAATDDQAINQAVAAEAEVRRIWCNCAAPPEAGNCHVLAAVRREGVTVALGTDGASPFAARRLRERVEQVISPEVAQLVSLLGELRSEVQARVATESARRACYETMWDSAALDRLAAGDPDGARAVLQAILDEAANG